MLGFLFGGGNLGKYLIIIAVVSIIVGGFFLYQRHLFSSMQNQLNNKQQEITKLQEQISGLLMDTEKLKISNRSLANLLLQKANENEEIRKEMEKINKIINESNARLEEITEELLNEELNNEKLTQRKGKEASNLLSKENNRLNCLFKNINDPDSKC